jgi:hypothetical protein
MDIGHFERTAPSGVPARSRTFAERIGHPRAIEIADSVRFYPGNTPHAGAANHLF